MWRQIILTHNKAKNEATLILKINQTVHFEIIMEKAALLDKNHTYFKQLWKV